MKGKLVPAPHVRSVFLLQIRGVPPVEMVERCKRSDKFFQGQTPRYLNNLNKRVRRGPPMSVSLSSVLKDTDVGITKIAYVHGDQI